MSKDGIELWSANKQMQYTPPNQGTGHPLANLIGAAVNDAITRAAPNQMPLARMANEQVFVSGPTAIQDGPYRAPK